ncbi:hypothetical protein WA026_012332 [Henosepilachna vigintioctopunctata]|uniref:Uncharacterized protein n=1 Tax=Henosepilachna vigintioctopunctata TaxID=420089 RepID=A0AAW1UYL7_9CUCU
MARVVPDQKGKFESDELFRRLSRESEVRYNGSRERPMEDRQLRLQNGYQEGHTEIAFAATGTNLQLVFTPPTSGYMPDKECDFEKDPGKVHIKSSFIMNGVGCLEFNEERAAQEDVLLREQIDRFNQRLREFENKPRVYRQQERSDQDLEVRLGPVQSRNYMKMY